jgi:hypothetical protein
MDAILELSRLLTEAHQRAIEHLREIARQTQLGEAFRDLPINTKE